MIPLRNRKTQISSIMEKKQAILLAGVTALAATSSACQAKQKAENKKPLNIVFIMTDDHSLQTISAYDKRFIQTPNIDRIANEGVLLPTVLWPTPSAVPVVPVCLPANTVTRTDLSTTITISTGHSKRSPNYCRRPGTRLP